MSRAVALCLALALSSGNALAQSETTSPLDYAPVIIASAWSSDSDGPAMQLSIQCRRGRTDLVIASPALTGRPEDYRVSYTVDDGPMVMVPAGRAASGTGIAIRDDVVRLLTGLPHRGELAFQVALPPAAPLQGRYALTPLHAVLDRMAVPCKWSTATDSPPAAPRAQPK